MGSPLPTIIVTGRYVDLNNQPVDGYVLLTPVQRVVGQGWVVLGRTVTAYVRDGLLSTTIIADSDALTPDLFVRVSEHLENCSGSDTVYTVQPVGATIDLSTAPRVTTPPPGVAYIPASALGQPGGVATLGSDGKLTLSQRPPGGGGGGVTSHHDLEDLTTGDDHPQYLNVARGDVRYAGKTATETALAGKEPTGTAAAAVAAHVAHADPHAQYLNTPRGDARYVRPTQLAPVATGGSYADLTGQVPTSALPALAITDVYTINSQAAMLALAAQRGDVAIRTDTQTTLILAADDPAQLANWKVLPTPADAVVSVNGQTGIVVLSKDDVGLGDVTNTADLDKPISTATQAALDTKLDLTLMGAAGDLIMGTGDNTANRLPRGLDGQVLGVSGDTLTWVPASTSELQLYPPSAAGAQEWTTDPKDCPVDFGHGNGVLLMMRFRYRGSALAISEIGFAVASAASDPGAYSGVALYDDGLGVVNRLGQSADAGPQWTSQGVKSIPLTTPVAVTPGSYYRAAILWQGSNPGRIAGQELVILDALLNYGTRRSTYLTGQTGFPATLDVGAMTTNNAVYWMVMK